mgnify:CR=1 FL=1
MPLTEKQSFGRVLPELHDTKFAGRLLAIEGAERSWPSYGAGRAVLPPPG